MSDILTATRTHLLTVSGVTSLVGSRIYFDVLPQSATLPSVVLELTTTEVMDKTLQATGVLHRAQVVAYAYADSHSKAVLVADAIVAGTEYAKGTWGSLTVKHAEVEHVQHVTEPPRDGSDNWRHVRGVFLIIWHL